MLVSENKQNRFIVFAGGGSGGHLFPGLAVAQQVRQIDTQVRILFLATSREVDKRILEPSGFEYVIQLIRPLPRRPWQVLDFYRRWKASISLCREVFQHQKPYVVMGLGGFASAPALKVAARYHLPTAMLNSDAVPGIANKFCCRYADTIFLQWASSQGSFGKHASKGIVTGCPIRADIVDRTWKVAPGAGKRKARQQLKLDPDINTIVVLGGSQGAVNVHNAVIHALASRAVQLERWQVLALTGSDTGRWKVEYEEIAPNVRIIEYSHRMDLVMSAADLIIARAGASSLAEIAAAGLPAILLPYPYHRDKHQLHNAKVLSRAGAAKIVTDYRDTPKTAQALARVIDDVIREDNLHAMSVAARGLARPDAGRDIARHLLE